MKTFSSHISSLRPQLWGSARRSIKHLHLHTPGSHDPAEPIRRLGAIGFCDWLEQGVEPVKHPELEVGKGVNSWFVWFFGSTGV
jgi:hypothetical protein